MVFCTLRLDIYVHFGMTMFHFTLQVIGLFALAPLVEAPDGIIYRPDSTEMAIRVLVALLSEIVSNLVAFGKHRSLQRSFEAALDVHYQMRASRRRMEAVDSLLSSMVPPSALVRLLEGEQVHDRSPIASVLFSDMVHFTLWSSKRNPSDVVSMLSVLVRELDVLAADMGVSKVKTIGDCYWAVTGIPSQVKLHAEVMIHFALAMLALVRKPRHTSTGTTQAMPTWAAVPFCLELVSTQDRSKEVFWARCRSATRFSGRRPTRRTAKYSRNSRYCCSSS